MAFHGSAHSHAILLYGCYGSVRVAVPVNRVVIDQIVLENRALRNASSHAIFRDNSIVRVYDDIIADVVNSLSLLASVSGSDKNADRLVRWLGIVATDGIIEDSYVIRRVPKMNTDRALIVNQVVIDIAGFAAGDVHPIIIEMLIRSGIVSDVMNDVIMHTTRRARIGAVGPWLHADRGAKAVGKIVDVIVSDIHVTVWAFDRDHRRVKIAAALDAG